MIDKESLVRALQRVVDSKKIPCLASAGKDRDGDPAFRIQRLNVQATLRRLLIDGDDFDALSCIDEITGPGGGYLVFWPEEDLVHVKAITPNIDDTEDTSAQEDMVIFRTALAVAGDRRAGTFALSGKTLNVSYGTFLPADASDAIIEKQILIIVRGAIFSMVRYHVMRSVFRSGAHMMGDEVVSRLVHTGDALCGFAAGRPEPSDGI